MKRRTLLSVGGLLVAGSAAGCLGSADPATRESPRELEFDRQESQHVVELSNDREEAVDVVVTVEGTDTTREQVSLDGGGSTLLTGLFADGDGPYTVSVSADDETATTRFRTRGSPKDKLSVTVRADGITLTQEHRPAADLTIANQRDSRVVVTVTVDERGTDTPRFRDTLIVPPNGGSAYRDVFAPGSEYGVTVQVDGLSESITHTDSFTSGLSILVEQDSLRVDAFDM